MSVAVREIVEIDEDLCDGCGLCIPSCAEGAIQMINGKAKLVNDSLCDGFGNCLGECPQDAIRIIKREAAEFDERLVEQHLQQIAQEPESEQDERYPVQHNHDEPAPPLTGG